MDGSLSDDIKYDSDQQTSNSHCSLLELFGKESLLGCFEKYWCSLFTPSVRMSETVTVRSLVDLEPQA